MILKQDDFIDIPYRIPNQKESVDFQNFIDKKETEYLKKILGLTLYREFVEGWDGIEDPAQIWKDLVYGTNEEDNPDGDGDFEYADTPCEYLGLVELLRPAIYSDWLSKNYRTWDNGGTTIPKDSERATAVLPDVEIVESWNAFVNKLGNNCSHRNTFYGFMTDRTEDYESWEDGKYFEPQYYRNQFDL